MKLKHIYIYIYTFICVLNSNCQINLVPNPSFEDTLNDCQSQMFINNVISYVKYWKTNHAFSTPDYYNNCANTISYPNICTIPLSYRSFQHPRTKDAYIGIATYYPASSLDSSKIDMEYVSTKLKHSLKANSCYYGEFYVNLGNVSLLTTNQISMLFTANNFTTSPYSYTNTIQPQIQWDTTQYFTDTLNWIKISGKFIAQGGEQYLTIGNFRDGTHLKKRTVNSIFTNCFGGGPVPYMSYILIDDVALYELPTPQLGALNYTICNNSDSLVLGDTARLQTTYQWFVNGVPISTSNTISVKPTQTTNYVLQSTQCGVTNQTITVTYSTNCEPVTVTEPIIPNVFTPNYDNVNDTFKFELYNSTLKNFTIYDRWGLEIYTTHLNQHHVIWDGRTTSGMESTAGVYFYVLEYTDVNGDTRKKNGYVTLIK